MSMSVAYAMMSSGDISIRSPENMMRCLELTTDLFGTGRVYYKVYAVTSLARSFRFDQVADAYIDYKVMKHLVDSLHGEFVSHAAAPALLIYAWRSDYEQIKTHNQHNGYNFVILDEPSADIYQEHGRITQADVNSFNGI